ncbi:MAG: hypothetical protein HY392_01215 [Candidatus Diapherotrites archaeon]|nr:hypothetical protein [Candidatus Diapherotrites archaeon]
MDRKRLAIVAVPIILAIGGAWFFGFNNTGFVALPSMAQDPLPEAEEETGSRQTGKNNQANAVTGVQSVSAGLSFEEVKPTELEAKITKGKIASCPQTAEATIAIKNTGRNTAERLKSSFHGFAVKECGNCTTRQIKPGEEISVKVLGCSEQGSAFAQFWALNAEKKTVFLD